MKSLLLLVLLTLPAAADQTIQPCWHARNIYPDIEAVSATINMASSSANDLCTINYTLRQGQVANFLDVRGQQQTLLAELATLEDALDAGTITQAQLRRLIKIVLRLTRMSTQQWQ